MKRTIQFIFATFLIASVAMAQPNGHVLRVQVLQPDNADFSVNLTIPLQMIRAMRPMIENAIADAEWEDMHGVQGDLDLHALWKEFRNAGAMDWIEVNDGDQRVYVRTTEDMFLVNATGAENGSDELEKVEVQIPLVLGDALFEHEGQIDVDGLIDTLELFAGQDLVRVTANDASIRVWID